jgi:hypothetical protein
LSRETLSEEQKCTLTRLDNFVNFINNDILETRTKLANQVSRLNISSREIEGIAAMLKQPSSVGYFVVDPACRNEVVASMDSLAETWRTHIIEPTAAVLRFFKMESKYKAELLPILNMSHAFKILNIVIRNMDHFYNRPSFAISQNFVANPSGSWGYNKSQLKKLMLEKGYAS